MKSEIEKKCFTCEQWFWCHHESGPAEEVCVICLAATCTITAIFCDMCLFLVVPWVVVCDCSISWSCSLWWLQMSYLRFSWLYLRSKKDLCSKNINHYMSSMCPCPTMLTHYIMDYPMHNDTISMGLPIVYFKGSQVEFSKLWFISVLEACDGCWSTRLRVSSVQRIH